MKSKHYGLWACTLHKLEIIKIYHALSISLRVRLLAQNRIWNDFLDALRMVDNMCFKFVLHLLHWKWQFVRRAHNTAY